MAKYSFLFLLLIGCQSIKTIKLNPCHETRAAIDIGSTTTKMVVAKVDKCEKKVLTVIAPAPGEKIEIKVPYTKSIITNEVINHENKKITESYFSKDVMLQGIDVLKQFVTIGKEYGAEKFSAVGTSAFRAINAKKAKEFIKQIEAETGIPVQLISQQEEANIGFQGALSKVSVAPQDALVWDIGGGSVQISYQDKNKRIKSYKTVFANEAMHRYLIQNLQKKDYKSTNSPNPIDNESHLKLAIAKAKAVALKELPVELRKMARNKKVIGIGGAHYNSNCEVLKLFTPKGCTINKEVLRETVFKIDHLSDEDLTIQGYSDSLKYAPFRISTALLTLGYMQALGVSQIRATKVNMSDGILLLDRYWSKE